MKSIYIISVICLLSIHYISTSKAAALETAQVAVDVIDKGVDVVNKIDGILTKKFNAHHNAVANRPNDLISSAALDAAMKNIGKDVKEINFNPLPGFEGLNSFEPSGWKISSKGNNRPSAEPKGQNLQPSIYPQGVGYALMNGCFGSNYQRGDPCYASKSMSTKCLNQIDAANFIGVGFDGRGFYSSDSRKQSIIQRVCAGKATFDGKDIPDNMNIFSIYDYTIKTHTYESAGSYVEYLQEKAATSKVSNMFHKERQSWSNAFSISSNFLYWSVGGGVGSGSSQSTESGQSTGSMKSIQNTRSSRGRSNNYIAVLEAELKLFEITLDNVCPNDLSLSFFGDYLKLPNSYYQVGADVELQSFVLRYGTHFIKSSKFGGQLLVTKTSTSESSLSLDEFSEAAENEFSAMFSTLSNSYHQSQVSFNVFGNGFKNTDNSQQASGLNKNAKADEQSNTNKGKMTNSRAQFIQTSMEIKGGDAQMAKSIMDFYSPSFKNDFSDWLDSVPTYPKPYEFTLEKISKILDINAEGFFTTNDVHIGCFSSKELQEDPQKNLTYFESNANNRTERHYCEYGTDKKRFLREFNEKRMALERAETIYMAEGPFSTSSFEIAGGSPGCETYTLDYVNAEQSKTWPSWNDMNRQITKMLFDLPYDLNSIAAQDEVLVRHYNNMWFSKSKTGTFSIHESCKTSKKESMDGVVCVRGFKFQFDENSGFLQLYTEGNPADLVKNIGVNRTVGKVISLDSFNTRRDHFIGKLHEVPCDVQWANSHRIDPNTEHACIHFTASSEGNIYVIFSEIPNNHETWIYLQLSPDGVAFYHGMLLKKVDRRMGIGSLGDSNLYESYFVCLKQGNDSIKVMYGKSSASKQIGEVKAAFNFPDTHNTRLSFYTFGSGEERITLNDVRVVNALPVETTCSEHGLILKNGECVIDCHPECKGCHQAHDAKSCISCKKFKNMLPDQRFECVAVCPPGKESNMQFQMCSECKPGYMKPHVGNFACSPCPIGKYQKRNGAKDCIVCEKGHFTNTSAMTTCHMCNEGFYNDDIGQNSCRKCPFGQFQDKMGSDHCVDCEKGHYANNLGTKACHMCNEGFYNDEIGQKICKKCPLGQYQQSKGRDHCNYCEKGHYSDSHAMTICKMCNEGFYNDDVGQQSCKRCPTGKDSAEGSSSCLPASKACKKGTYYADLECCKKSDEKCKDYRGTQNMTAKNETCKHWNETDYTQDKYRKADLIYNYCRNPDGQNDAWCYIKGSGWGRCGIRNRRCDGSESVCKNAPAGSYVPSAGSDSASKCRKGTFQDQEGKASCKDCIAGHYQAQEGQIACLKCPAGQYQKLTGQTGCLKCPVGEYQAQYGQTSCHKCPAGQYQSQNGQTGCQLCPAGRYQNRIGQVSCRRCPAGTYQYYAGQASCFDCPVGKYQNLGGQNNCLDCPAGQYQSQRGQTGCHSCPPGTYRRQVGQTSCLI